MPYSSLNLGLNTDDKPENILENRKRFFECLGIKMSRVTQSYQVHKDKILKVTRSKIYEGYDALITENSNTFLSVTVADCTPVLIYDAKNQAVAAIHAGWKGTVLDITAKTLQKMSDEFKTNPKDCYVYVGTCIYENSYEVGEDVAAEFAVGDDVLLSTQHLKLADSKARTAKFAERYIGPFRVQAVVNANAYTLDLPPTLRIHPTINIERLKKYTRGDAARFPGRPVAATRPPPVATTDNGAPSWEVAAVLARRHVKGKKQYLVSWVGYDRWEATWEPEAHLEGAQELVDEFESGQISLTSQAVNHMEEVDSSLEV